MIWVVDVADDVNGVDVDHVYPNPPGPGARARDNHLEVRTVSSIPSNESHVVAAEYLAVGRGDHCVGEEGYA